MKHSKKVNKRVKIKDFVKKNRKLEVLKNLPPDVIARAIKSKLEQDELKRRKN